MVWASRLIQVPPDFIRGSGARSTEEHDRGGGDALRFRYDCAPDLADQACPIVSPTGVSTTAAGIERPIKTKSEWLAEWRSMGVRFSWSILADDPTFAVGDWIQGFTAMAAHGLSLKVVWSIGGIRHAKFVSRIWSAPQRQRPMTRPVLVALLTIACLAGAAELPPLGHSMNPVSPPVPAPDFTLQDEEHALGRLSR